MQPQTKRSSTSSTTSVPASCGDEAQLYRQHHHDLIRAVGRAVNGNRGLIEDACHSAWAILLRRQPHRASVFRWLYVVAIHEAYRLSRIERRDAHLEDLGAEVAWEEAIADRVTVDDAIEARWALRLLAELPARQREDLALLIAGYRYREIAEITGGRTFTNVNKHLAKARAHVRRELARSA
jgi:RNA polymerase sigma factor (sigma-70 family)